MVHLLSSKEPNWRSSSLILPAFEIQIVEIGYLGLFNKDDFIYLPVHPPNMKSLQLPSLVSK